MKKILSLFIVLAFAITALAENPTLNLKVSGMTCGGCENKFKSAATQIPGIQEVMAVSAAEGSATIKYDPAIISAEKAVQSLAESTGYTITANTSLGMVQSEGKPAACCQKGKKTAACKNPEKPCNNKKASE
jgi:Zn2+/Cd2+-exporting ATPase